MVAPLRIGSTSGPKYGTGQVGGKGSVAPKASSATETGFSQNDDVGDETTSAGT